jgi:uncharacterized membrane protein YbhN (UPF0104 family)
MAGMASAFRVGLPILVSALAASTILFVRHAETLHTSAIGGAIRGAIGAGLLACLITVWVRKRDRWKRAFRKFMSDGQSYKQRSTA